MARSKSKTARSETILIVEDDRSLREGLTMNFQARGFEVLSAADGDQGLELAFDARPDLIILDLMLPRMSGIEILAELREREEHVPVLILSARDTTSDKVEGLETGADDYLTKPFELSELFARVEVMLRRKRVNERSTPKQTLGGIEIDRATRQVQVHGEPVELLAKEFDILCLLASAPDKPFARQIILEKVWGWGFSGTERTVNNYILSLRQKVEKDPANPRHILTVRQVGYKLVP